MNVRHLVSRFSLMSLMATAVLSLTISPTAFGQASRGGGKSNAVKNVQPFSRRSETNTQVKNHAKFLAKQQAKHVFQTKGKSIVKRKALENGFAKQQVMNHKIQVKNKLENHIKHEAKSRAKDLVENHGRQLVKNQLDQQNVAYASRLAGYPAIKKRFDRLQFLRQPSHHHFHWSWRKWCGYYPAHCHWWYSCCGPNYYFDPTCSLTYDWYYYYSCPVEVRSMIAACDVRWSLGLKCVLIPDKGLGIEAVNPDSPADLAGLEPGMIIIAANGIAIANETSMPTAIDQSQGVLQLDILSSASTETSRVTVILQPMLVADF